VAIERQHLSSHPFLSALTEAQLEELLPCVHLVRYTEGQFIFREGGEADTLYLLRTGRVTLEQHVPRKGDVQVESLNAGDILGLSWLFPGARWTLDARAVEPVEAFALPAECIRERMLQNPALGLTLTMHLLHEIYERLVHVRLQRLDVFKSEG
jgi:CRP/FNR family cyclic AMP-dependent transcriptional regulator